MAHAPGYGGYPGPVNRHELAGEMAAGDNRCPGPQFTQFPVTASVIGMQMAEKEVIQVPYPMPVQEIIQGLPLTMGAAVDHDGPLASPQDYRLSHAHIWYYNL